MSTPALVIDCFTCRQQKRCSSEPTHRRETVFAWAKDLARPSCRDYSTRYYHGIEGVLSHPSPRPTHRRGVTRINHGGSA